MIDFSPSSSDELLYLDSGLNSGYWHMALDDALLEYFRLTPNRYRFLIRTFLWEKPTISLGAHQSNRDLEYLRHTITGSEADGYDWVRRPTGGRAIRHGQDISFSFITNMPIFYQASLRHCYLFFNRILQSAFMATGIKTQTATQQDHKAYTRSPVCFETHTAFDLTDQSGQKISGSAQCRRGTAILQQGTVFYPNIEIYDCFAKSLQHAAFEILKTPLVSGNYLLSESEFVTLFERQQACYSKESFGIAANV